MYRERESDIDVIIKKIYIKYLVLICANLKKQEAEGTEPMNRD